MLADVLDTHASDRILIVTLYPFKRLRVNLERLRVKNDPVTSLELLEVVYVLLKRVHIGFAFVCNSGGDVFF